MAKMQLLGCHNANRIVRRQRICRDMPELIGVNDAALSQDERIARLVSAVGGPVKAAAIVGKTRTHIDNMRKAGAPLRLDDVLALANEAGVSLEWVATGRENGSGQFADAGAAGFAGLPGFTRLQPLRPQVKVQDGRSLELWAPSDIAVSEQWLDSMFGLTGPLRQCRRWRHGAGDREGRVRDCRYAGDDVADGDLSGGRRR
ncbi:MAG: hypothetical protein ABI398_04925 [Devosia sp.]